MSERMTLAAAREAGLLQRARCFRGQRGGSSSAGVAAATRTGSPRRPAQATGRDPQAELYAALCAAFPGERIEEEVTGLVPGRKYRADIYFPDHRLAVEVDGFAFHSSKSAFQSDRERQNAFVMAGYRVLRYYNGQIRNEIDRVIEEVRTCLGPAGGEA